ncbi:MAG: LON peptidase substrate-binding domain-containing protein [Verrucomicrobiota bacterium]
MITIPETCGTIILPETVLFPHGTLPLHIFEPRYREMLEEALNADCMICVGTATGEEAEGANPATFTHPIGTIGLIRTSREMEDGRSNLILHGILRVHFRAWLPGKPYPLASIAPATAEPISPDEAPRRVSELRDHVNHALSGFPPSLKQKVNELLDRTDGEPSILADAISQQFVQEPSLRLELLSENSLSNRFDILRNYLSALADNQR